MQITYFKDSKSSQLKGNMNVHVIYSFIKRMLFFTVEYELLDKIPLECLQKLREPEKLCHGTSSSGTFKPPFQFRIEGPSPNPVSASSVRLLDCYVPVNEQGLTKSQEEL